MEKIIVTEKCGTLKALGREALRGKWKPALIAILIYFLASYIPQFILTQLFGNARFVGSFYTLLVSGPLYLGYSIFALTLFRNQDIKIGQIFYGFEKFGKSLGLYLVMMILVFLWALIAIPGVLVAYSFRFLVPFILLLLVPAILAALRYSQAFFVLADHPEKGIMGCIAESKRVMAGNKLKYFLLQLSFVGWIFLAGIPPMSAAIVYALKTFRSMNIQVGTASQDMLENYASSLNVSTGMTALIYVFSLGMVVVSTYMMATSAAFYEIAAGNLRPGYIKAEAIIIDDTYEAPCEIEEESE